MSLGMDLMCSAAYYIGSATSHIIANKRADAIGVLV
jgi:protease-4